MTLVLCGRSLESELARTFYVELRNWACSVEVMEHPFTARMCVKAAGIDIDQFGVGARIVINLRQMPNQKGVPTGHTLRSLTHGRT